MSTQVTAAHLRSVAARLGWRLGARQAQEHTRYTGAPWLAGKQLYAVAHLAWKYEARQLLGHDRDEHAFVDCYVTAYNSCKM